MNRTGAGVCGPTSLRRGTKGDVRLGKGGAVVVQHLHGRYYEQSARGRVFIAAQAQATVIRASGTTAAFGVFNPLGNKIAAVPIRWCLAVTTPPTTPVVGAYVLQARTAVQNIVLPVTNDPVIPALIGSDANTTIYAANNMAIGSSVGLVPIRVFELKLTGASSTIPYVQLVCDFDGMLVIPPGGFLGLYQINADTTNASGLNNVIWEEVDL